MQPSPRHRHPELMHLSFFTRQIGVAILSPSQSSQGEIPTGELGARGAPGLWPGPWPSPSLGGGELSPQASRRPSDQAARSRAAAA